MKSISFGIILIVTLLLLASCAFALLAPRPFHERRYRPCDAREVKDNVGKLCHRYCTKYRWLRADISENCVNWETDVKDFSKQEDFEAFRLGGFVLKKEID